MRPVRRIDQTAKRAFGSIDLRIRPDYRKAVAAGLTAIAFVVASRALGGAHASSLHARLGVYGCSLGFVVAAVLAVRLVANELARVSTLRGGVATAGPLRVGALLIGYIVITLTTLDLMALPLGHLLAGGAIAGVVVGIAAQQSLGNLFAGLVLLFTRPYVPGESIRIGSGALGGPFEGTVTGVGLLYTTLATADGPVNIPNAGLLAAAVGTVPAPTVSRRSAEHTVRAARRRHKTRRTAALR